HVFGAPLVNDTSLQSELLSVLEMNERNFAEAAWTNIRLVSLEAAVQLAHLKFTERVAVGEFAEKTNQFLVMRGDPTKHSPREVGPILTSFGLKIDRRSNANTILLNAVASECLHRQALQASVLNVDPTGRCSFCNKIASPKRSAL